MAVDIRENIAFGTQLALGLALAAAVAFAAHRASALTTGGAIAAAIVGTLTFGIGGWAPAVLLLTFFISSTLLSRQGQDRKHQLADRSAKGGKRDEWQVFANGAVPALLATGYGITGQGVWLIGVAGALAASNADTWATEAGLLARTKPRLITTLQPVDPGSSGAISWLGSSAALAGAALIGLVAVPFAGTTRALIVAGVAGLLASFLDSLLGASLQAQYRCPQCDQLTERHPIHTCGTTTTHVRGWKWLGNDQVNLWASISGAAIAVGLWTLLT